MKHCKSGSRVAQMPSHAIKPHEWGTLAILLRVLKKKKQKQYFRHSLVSPPDWSQRSRVTLHVLQFVDKALLIFGMVGLGEMEGGGDGLLAFCCAAGGEEDLGEDGVDISGVRGLLGGGLREGEGLGKAALTQ